MSDGKTKKAKKGIVVNRKHNRTVNPNIAHSDPKWVDMGGGVLKRLGPKGAAPNYARVGKLGKLVPMTRHAIGFFLRAQEETRKAAEALKASLVGEPA